MAEFARNLSHQGHSEEGAEGSCWCCQLWTAVHVRRLDGEAAPAAGADPGEAMCSAGAYQEERTSPGGKPIPPAVSLQHPLPTTLNIMPTGKGRILEGPQSSLQSRP